MQTTIPHHEERAHQPDLGVCVRIRAVAYLLGHRDVDKAMTDARVIHFLRAYFAEVVETVPPVPGVDLEQYQNRLIQRFSNVHIRDQLARLAEDGSMKVRQPRKRS